PLTGLPVVPPPPRRGPCPGAHRLLTAPPAASIVAYRPLAAAARGFVSARARSGCPEGLTMLRTCLTSTVALFLAALPAAGADSLFAEPVHDFGTVPRGVLLSHPFRLTNAGPAPVRVVGVRVSCGCTTAAMQPAE